MKEEYHFPHLGLISNRALGQPFFPDWPLGKSGCRIVSKWIIRAEDKITLVKITVLTVGLLK